MKSVFVETQENVEDVGVLFYSCVLTGSIILLFSHITNKEASLIECENV